MNFEPVKKLPHGRLTRAVQQSILKCSGRCNERSAISIFDTLKATSLSDLTHKRRVHCNPLPKGKCMACGEGSSEPKNVTATQGVK